jgi:hypothetical protein
MKVPQPYRCDYCDKLKGDSNHWFLRYTFAAAHFWLIPWDDGKAASDDHEHICGQECAAKALAKWMAAQ